MTPSDELLRSAQLAASCINRFPVFKPKPVRHRRLSVSAAIKRAKALGVDVTVGTDGSLTFKTSSENLTGNPVRSDGNEWDQEYGPR
jgi:hypothetical protein